MAASKSIGVFFYDIPELITDPIDYPQLIEFSRSKAGVVDTWCYSRESWTETFLQKKIEQNHLDRIVLAGGFPGTLKSLFAKAMTLAGKDPNMVVLAGFNEHGISSTRNTDRAKAILSSAISGLLFDTLDIPDESSVNPATLIIGGGIAGIQAALEIANGGNDVFLLEKSGTIGGKMATFDKTFPTLDCAACILTPKMVEVNQHPGIHLMTYCDVQEVSGEPGNYQVKVLQKARKVNVSTCIGCGTCAEKCPAQAPSEFDFGTTLRKAIYIPFPQAVPNKYMIDAASCIYIKNGKCKACVKACPVPDCINLDEADSEVILSVGNIIVATGYKPFDAGRMEQYGYGKLPNVLTSLEFERLLNASGPTGGNIHLRSQDKKGNWIFSTDAPRPESVAIIHCVGSRDKNYNKYCSRVCCMYSLKFSHLVLEKLPDADVYQFFIDMRSFGKGYEEFYERIREEGAVMIRGKTAKVEEGKNGKLLIRGEDILVSEIIEQTVDMVVLSIGLEPGEDTARLAKMMGIPLSDGGWFEEANYNTDPTATIKGGISIAGTCQGPKDIPDSVAQGSAAAARVIQSIMKGKVALDWDSVSLGEIEKRIESINV